jgi:hypothetical protein
VAYFIDLFHGRSYRIWRAAPGIPDGVQLEVGNWDIHYLEPPDGSGAVPFLCFSADNAPITQLGCGQLFVTERYDYTTQLRWLPLELDGSPFIGVRSPISRPTP